jgi:hypothetical protein
MMQQNYRRFRDITRLGAPGFGGGGSGGNSGFGSSLAKML